MRPDELTFESAQKELEQIVERLERGGADLDEAIKLWDVAKSCSASASPAQAAEGTIEELAQRAAGAAPLPPAGDAR